MSISAELQSLAQVSSEVNESEVKLTFANQCIKAQEALANKLGEEIHRRKELCYLKKNENHKLEAEIKNAELEIVNLRIAYNTIKLANTEIKKELHLTDDRKSETQELIKKGEKKYEDLWIQCKNRYENIPLVKKLMQDKNKCEELKINMNVLDNDIRSLEKAIKEKKKALIDKEQKQITQLAIFFVHEVPAAINTIKEKTVMINNITKELEDIAKEKEADKQKASEAAAVKTLPMREEKTRSDNKWAIDDSPMMPKLHLPSVDMDVINFKLNINKVTINTSPVKRTVSFTELEKNTNKKTKSDESLKDNYISCYLNKTASEDYEDKSGNSPTNYSKKKLINIIEDIKIDDIETYKLMTQANIDKFQNANVITASKNARQFIKSAQALEIEEIHGADGSYNNKTDVIVPPSPFLDLTQGDENEPMQDETEDIVQADGINGDASLKSHNESHLKETNKKKVSFDLPIQNCVTTNAEIASMSVDHIVDGPNESGTSQLDLSEITDDNCMAIKDMILKKSQLDLSPQFVYGKNSLLKRNDDKVVTSKFFDNTTNEVTKYDGVLNTENQKNDEVMGQDVTEQINMVENVTKDQHRELLESTNLVNMEDDENVASPKASGTDKPVTGLLFTHGAQGIPDCLDISMSTTGYEEGDPEFPTCFDSSLLLSPKADLPVQVSGNNSEICSQDLPSFLTGFRKGGLSFFKPLPSSDPNTDSNKQNPENNFNFNFGSDDKKTRGGLFSFFR